MTQLKPGATSLLVGKGEGLPGEQVVLAYQRYGRGKSLAWTVHDSWRWQMHADIPVEDQTHETLWRQLLRWLVSYVPEPVEVTASSDIVAPGERVEIRAEVRDEEFLPVNNAKVSATVKRPGGQRSRFLWTGRWRRTASTSAGSPPTRRASTASGSRPRRARDLGGGSAWVEAAALENELFDAELRRESLERLAAETAGRYYDLDTAARVVDDLAFSREGSTLIERRDLWDMPIVFLLSPRSSPWSGARRRRLGMA